MGTQVEASDDPSTAAAGTAGAATVLGVPILLSLVLLIAGLFLPAITERKL